MAEVVIDGVPYVPQGFNGQAGAIGVGITTHNRYETFTQTLEKIEQLTPGAKIVVVDDASRKKVPNATFRFDHQVGIARAKNKCLELLEDCEHIFLFDDDCYPLKEDWWRPYAESPEPHLMRIFEDLAGRQKIGDSVCLYRDSDHVAYSHPRGMMLYVHRCVLDTVGGMDPGFGLWGWEHCDWSNRIHSAGMTSWRFADVASGGELIYSMDEHCEVERSIEKAVRDDHFKINSERYLAQRNITKYCEYREQRDLVLTSMFTGQPDPQRRRKPKVDPKRLEPLLTSVKEALTVVIHDELGSQVRDGVEFVQIESTINPYHHRWLAQWQYLRQHPEFRFVWCVDSTDVEMLQEPWEHMIPGKLYIGSEHRLLGCDWMRTNHPHYETFFDEFGALPLLNCGLIGGDRTTVLAYLHDVIKEIFDTGDHLDGSRGEGVGDFDMGVTNHVAYTRWADQIITGPQVHTIFKAETKTECSWWKHK